MIWISNQLSGAAIGNPDITLECITLAAGKSGRIPRLFKANDIIERAVSLADFPAKLEPIGLCKHGSKKFKTDKPLA
jgi:hypothetical protein